MDQVRLPLSDVLAESGQCYTAVIPLITPNERDHRRTGVRLFEDDVELAFGGALHAEIREFGEGRFSQWGETLYFSSTDGSDPRANRRRYTIVFSSSDSVDQMEWRLEPLSTVQPSEIHAGEGFSYLYELPRVYWAWSSDDETIGGSRLVVLEDGYPLPLAHSNRGHIAQFGLGRYRHEGVEVRFSTSDNSDPRTNGRTYHLALGDVRNHRFVDPFAGDAAALREVIPAPRIEWPSGGEVIADARPTIRVADPDPELLYYWELDTVPSFDSPDLHRRPRTRRGRSEPNLLRVLDREPSFSSDFAPLYRLGAIAPVLMPRNAPQFTAMMAARLGYGLEAGEDELREVYSYMVSQIYPVADSVSFQSPETTWLLDRGLCASASSLTSAVLQSLGYRTRRAQVDARVHGEVLQRHSSLEVFLNGRWSILDSWYEFYLPGVSYQDLAGEADQKKYFAFVRRPDARDSADRWTPIYLSDHAKGRRYDRFDAWFAEFSSPEQERRLFSGEPAAIPDPEWSRIWPQATMPVWVRVRSVRVPADRVLSWLAPTRKALEFHSELIEVSPWTTVSFKVDLAKAYGFDEQR